MYDMDKIAGRSVISRAKNSDPFNRGHNPFFRPFILVLPFYHYDCRNTSMPKTLRAILYPPTDDARPSAAEYEAIGGEEDGPIERKTGEERGVYWCFWALGAGVLLSWNGGYHPLCCCL